MGLLSSFNKYFVGGSESSQRSNSGMDPRLMNRFLGNYDYAKRIADRLGPRQFADFTEDWRQGAGLVREAVDGPGVNAVRDATARAGQAISPSMVEAGSFLRGGVERYMNPYVENVVDTTLADMDRARQLALQDNSDAAIQAGAFGGSRHGVVEAETNRNFADRAAAAAASLRSRAFQDATTLQQQELDRNLAADTTNQKAGLLGDELNIRGAEVQGALGTQDQQLRLQLSEALKALGITEQELEQARLDAGRNAPMERLRVRSEALGVAPAGGAGTVSSSSGSSSSSTGYLNAFGNFFGGFMGGMR